METAAGGIAFQGFHQVAARHAQGREEPGGNGRGYRVATRAVGDRYRDQDRFLAEARRGSGSWWPEWARWLGEHSGAPTAPPPLGPPSSDPQSLADAPGRYVLQS